MDPRTGSELVLTTHLSLAVFEPTGSRSPKPPGPVEDRWLVGDGSPTGTDAAQ